MRAGFAVGLKCIRCGRTFDLGKMWSGCPSCKSDGDLANLTVEYEYSGIKKVMGNGKPSLPSSAFDRGIWRYRAFLPDFRSVRPVTLDEGHTPLMPLRPYGHGRDYVLFLKDEARNPTWSHKDRLASAGVTAAVALGYDTVVLSSTGNHGIAAAAYSACAGIRCTVLVPPETPGDTIAVLQELGAAVVEVGEGRWHLLKQLVEEEGWCPLAPHSKPMGGNPYGVEGYKTIAFEIWEQLRTPPDWVIVPSGHGETVFGIWKGFHELAKIGLITRVPRMIAAEPGKGPLVVSVQNSARAVARVELRGSVARSIDTDTSTWQALYAIKQSDGYAVGPSEEEIRQAGTWLSKQGIYQEAASWVAIGCIPYLINELEPHSKVVVIGTSSGLKNIRRTVKSAPRANPQKPHLFEVLRSHYNWTL